MLTIDLLVICYLMYSVGIFNYIDLLDEYIQNKWWKNERV